jgi:hypothetical protein
MEIPEDIKIHPIFTLYGADKEGNIYNVKLKRKINGTMNKMNQRFIGVGGKTILVSRFVYECFNEIITEGYQIDHKDNDRTNNKISNLQKLTKSENCKKKFREDGYKQNGQKMHRVESTEKGTNNKQTFRSISGAGKVLGICAASVWRVCRGEYFFATSKKDGKKYSFKYI